MAKSKYEHRERKREGRVKGKLHAPREHSRQAFVTDFLTNRSLDTTALSSRGAI